MEDAEEQWESESAHCYRCSEFLAQYQGTRYEQRNIDDRYGHRNAYPGVVIQDTADAADA